MKRVLWLVVRVLGFTVLAAVLAFGFLAWQIDRLGRQDQARRADAIVVMGARVDPDGGPGSDLTSRTLHAVDLWQAGYAPNIVCSGGIKDEPLSAASVCRRYAISLGVPPEDIAVADGTADTAGDARATATVMRERGWRSAIVVSHPLHLYRARLFLSEAGIDATTSPTTTNTEEIYLPLRLWYATREAGAILLAAADDRGWLPSSVKAQLDIWRLRLP